MACTQTVNPKPRLDNCLHWTRAVDVRMDVACIAIASPCICQRALERAQLAQSLRQSAIHRRAKILPCTISERMSNRILNSLSAP